MPVHNAVMYIEVWWLEHSQEVSRGQCCHVSLKTLCIAGRLAGRPLTRLKLTNLKSRGVHQLSSTQMSPSQLQPGCPWKRKLATTAQEH